jgi:hypothetical protein
MRTAYAHVTVTQKRLQSSSPPYSTLEEFANDMRLMFNNTLAYYDVYSPQYQVASKLKVRSMDLSRARHPILCAEDF